MCFHVICITFMYCIMQSYKIFVLIIMDAKTNIFGKGVRMKYQIQKNILYTEIYFQMQKYIFL